MYIVLHANISCNTDLKHETGRPSQHSEEASISRNAVVRQRSLDVSPALATRKSNKREDLQTSLLVCCPMTVADTGKV